MALTAAGLADQAGVPVLSRSGLSLIRSADAARFLEVARAHAVRILGVEGFRLVGQSVMPDMHAITDLSSEADPQESVEATERFLAVFGGPDLFLEFTLDDATRRH